MRQFDPEEPYADRERPGLFRSWLALFVWLLWFVGIPAIIVYILIQTGRL